MNRTKSLVIGLLLVAAVVALEEWRLAGLRDRIAQLGDDLAAAQAAIPPPPRPEPPGEVPEKLLRRAKIRQVSAEKPEDATAAATDPGDADPAKADVTPEPAPEPLAATEPATEPVVPPESVSSQVRSSANQALRNSIVKMYANLIDKFGFNNVEAGYFVDLLVESALNRQQFATDLSSAESDAERTESQRRAEQSAADIAKRMRTFLANDRDFGIFIEYQRLVEQPAEKAPE